MRTTIILDGALVKQAKRLSQADSLSALVREALSEYVAARSSQEVLALEGRIDVDPDWEADEERELSEDSGLDSKSGSEELSNSRASKSTAAVQNRRFAANPQHKGRRKQRPATRDKR
ncbi:MAG TPA: type II toxin-antitoxin system VapB family antitoxin [Acidobacteriota bacterium]|jgi:hypothetical protein